MHSANEGSIPAASSTRVGVAQWDESAGFRSPWPLVRFHLLIRGLAAHSRLFSFGDQGNGLTRLAWDQENLGSNPRSPTIVG